MTLPDDCPVAAILADHLREGREGLVRRWLDRIQDRVAIPPNRIFPTEELLNHVPLLIDGIADYLEDPADEITADVPVIAKAVELGVLRHGQGFGAHQILKEYELLGGVIFSHLVRFVDEIDVPCAPSELLASAQRLFRALAVIQQVTTDQFLRLADQRVREREERLRGFNRAVSHELKNRIGAAAGAVEMMQEDWLIRDEAQVRRFAGIAARNLAGMQEVLQSLIELSRLDTSVVQDRNVLLPEVASEVRRQLRDFAEARGVLVEIADLPCLEVPAAALELALSNYVSNGIKYRDPAAERPWVRMEGELVTDGDACEIVVRVRDNGRGVPDEARERLFERFFRAHETVTGEEGSGLGLSIVRETVEALGGRVWAEFGARGSAFALAIPCPTDDARGGELAP
jgi:signal transduction histidine kinase